MKWYTGFCAVQSPVKKTTMKIFIVLCLAAAATARLREPLTLNLDLKSEARQKTSLPSGFSWFKPLAAGKGECSWFGTLKISLGDYTQVRFDMNFHQTVSGYPFSIGDSQSNDGWGGDANHQQRDAEIMAYGKTIRIYANDFGGSGVLHSVPDFIQSQATIIVANEMATWNNYGPAFGLSLAPDHLFALAGQSDSGGVNKDIYFGLNQVVSGRSDRRGSGLCSVIITLS